MVVYSYIGTIKIHTLTHATASTLGKFRILFLMNLRITFPVNFKSPLPFKVYQKSNNPNFVQDMQFKIRAIKKKIAELTKNGSNIYLYF